MTTSATAPDEIVNLTLSAARAGEAALREACDALPTAVYTTDAEGRLGYHNPACASLAGRTPATGEDRWCVSWKLYRDDGSFLPHDSCPMAVTIRTGQPVRGVAAVVERPDGSRVDILPYPTPLFDEAGELIGAINLLVDISGAKEAEYLRAQALRCRRLAASVGDQRTVTTLKGMAAEYEQRALEKAPPN